MAAAKSKKTSEKSPDTVMAIIAYILFFVPLLTDAKKDAFVMFHVKQGLILFIAWIAVAIITGIPVLGWFAYPLYLVVFVLWVIGIFNAINGEKKALPVIGQYADRINL